MTNPTTAEIVETARECALDRGCAECRLRDYGQPNCLNTILIGAADRLEALEKELAALREQQRWIPVTERLPEGMKPVIVCRSGERVQHGYKDVGDWWKVYGTRVKKVTHWMPLPEPPKEG